MVMTMFDNAFANALDDLCQGENPKLNSMTKTEILAFFNKHEYPLPPKSYQNTKSLCIIINNLHALVVIDRLAIQAGNARTS